MTVDGMGLAMHHCLKGSKAPNVSFGIPLASIIAKHPLLGGGEAADSVVEEQRQRMKTKSKQSGFESRNITKFETKVTKAVPELGQEGDEATIPESRDIAKFDSFRIDQAPRAQEE